MTFTDIKLVARLSGMTSEHITELFETGLIDIKQADELIYDMGFEPVLCDQPEDEELAIAAETLIPDLDALYKALNPEE